MADQPMTDARVLALVQQEMRSGPQSVLIRQLQGQTPTTLIAGAIAVSGGAATVNHGSGFSVVYNAVGDYTVTFSVAFPTAPNVVMTAVHGSAAVSMTHASEPTTTTFHALAYDDTAAAINADFHFLATT